MQEPEKRTLTLNLDQADYDAICRAVMERQQFTTRDGNPVMPESESDTNGAALAEVCRGWLERIGKWPGRKPRQE